MNAALSLSMIRVIAKNNLSFDDVKTLSKILDISVITIRNSIKNNNCLYEVEPFSGAWEEERHELKRISDAYMSDELKLFDVIELDGEEVELLTPEFLRNSIAGLREIEIQTQRNVDLENGYIKTPEEFVPHDEDWT